MYRVSLLLSYGVSWLSFPLRLVRTKRVGHTSFVLSLSLSLPGHPVSEMTPGCVMGSCKDTPQERPPKSRSSGSRYPSTTPTLHQEHRIDSSRTSHIPCSPHSVHTTWIDRVFLQPLHQWSPSPNSVYRPDWYLLDPTLYLGL